MPSALHTLVLPTPGVPVIAIINLFLERKALPKEKKKPKRIKVLIDTMIRMYGRGIMQKAKAKGKALSRKRHMPPFSIEKN
ncbi:hypothetical protein C5S53_13110 [Methanophagales archaeon]|nr:hypothetical protein C5S53_13110 [Methanophagales archaeon]